MLALPFMMRPRWHDVLIVSAIVAVLSVGVWALWWDDVRVALGIQPKAGSGDTTTPVKPGQT